MTDFNYYADDMTHGAACLCPQCGNGAARLAVSTHCPTCRTQAKNRRTVTVLYFVFIAFCLLYTAWQAGRAHGRQETVPATVRAATLLQEGAV